MEPGRQGGAKQVGDDDDDVGDSLGVTYFPPRWVGLDQAPEGEEPKDWRTDDAMLWARLEQDRAEDEPQAWTSTEEVIRWAGLEYQDPEGQDFKNWKAEDVVEDVERKEEGETEDVDRIREGETFVEIPCGSTCTISGTVTWGTLRMNASKEAVVFYQCGQGDCNGAHAAPGLQAPRAPREDEEVEVLGVGGASRRQACGGGGLEEGPRGDPRINWVVRHLPRKPKPKWHK